jgi:hypothetical protein
VSRRKQQHQAIDLASLDALELVCDRAMMWRSSIAIERVFGEIN